MWRVSVTVITETISSSLTRWRIINKTELVTLTWLIVEVPCMCRNPQNTFQCIEHSIKNMLTDNLHNEYFLSGIYLHICGGAWVCKKKFAYDSSIASQNTWNKNSIKIQTQLRLVRVWWNQVNFRFKCNGITNSTLTTNTSFLKWVKYVTYTEFTE